MSSNARPSGQCVRAPSLLILLGTISFSLLTLVSVPWRASEAAPSEFEWQVSGDPWHLTIWAVRDGRSTQTWHYDLGRATSDAGRDAAGEAHPKPLLFERPVPVRLLPGRESVPRPRSRPRSLGSLVWDARRNAFLAASGEAFTQWIFEGGAPIRAVHQALLRAVEAPPSTSGSDARETVVFARAVAGEIMSRIECPACSGSPPGGPSRVEGPR